jgi:hypothetical protein
MGFNVPERLRGDGVHGARKADRGGDAGYQRVNWREFRGARKAEQGRCPKYKNVER